MLDRRDFLKILAAAGAAQGLGPAHALFAQQGTTLRKGQYAPGRIANELTLYLPGEEETLRAVPSVSGLAGDALTVKLGAESASIKTGDAFHGWRLLTIAGMNGVETAIFEKHVTHRGALAYVTEERGTIAWIPKYVGDLSKIRPRPTHTPHGVKLERAPRYIPGPDVTGEYLLNSNEDPCFENVAALGEEYIGWTLVANEQGGPKSCLYLEADGISREIAGKPEGEGTWEPDQVGAYFDPAALLSDDNPKLYAYRKGYSKRTLLGGYLPVANIGVWNAEYSCGYEVMVLLPPGEDAKPIGRVRSMVPDTQRSSEKDIDGTLFVDRYWNCGPQEFYSELAGIWNRWSSLYDAAMPISIPDEALLNAARGGITLSRCSYRGLEPTYQIGEGAYTKIPERSHALFPVAHYEFVWVQQLWNLNADADAYFDHYLDKYVLPNGDFLYNTQDQVEAPLNIGIFLTNSARSWDYGHDLDALRRRLPVLERMIDFVLTRYEYSKQAYSAGDRRRGLIYGSPEADLGDPHNDFPASHPLYYQNSVWTWRGFTEHARCLRSASAAAHDDALRAAADKYAALAQEMRGLIQSSLEATLALRNTAMKEAGITPFTPDDIHRDPKDLSSYENHRFMQDWFTADWGDETLDLGHLKHREIAGLQIIGLHTDGAWARTSNFMDHGSLSVKIRQKDYRPFLLNLYALLCYACDPGSGYAPEDAFIPGSFPGEGNRYGWASVVNSTLQPALGLRWLLCYEETHADVCHLQKAAPKDWFTAGKTISVQHCPTRFGQVSWTTHALDDHHWTITLEVETGFSGDIVLHIHPRSGEAIRTATVGTVDQDTITLLHPLFASQTRFEIDIT
ncbi:twin-arginine translocation signal domain-containing protein [Silvibacterium dinghuense]|uniref:twin-arginine translocation signal domain-containing protein n=1 Tax=Silvibacterium dinghuense TaxID=1560006 RepID=UPI001959BCB5|nr:twin-arginine translocation signal domain-containing protein [Silvibacterium dinghuense]GGH11407.1 hypothetical protein GCM10011586_30080 [Silvibacterium dinghuense]